MIALYKLHKSIERKFSLLLADAGQSLGRFYSLKSLLDQMMHPFVAVTTEPYAEELETHSIPVVPLSIDMEEVRREMGRLAGGERRRKAAVVCATERERRWLEREQQLSPEGLDCAFLLREELRHWHDPGILFAPIWEEGNVHLQPAKGELQFVEPSWGTLRRVVQQACSLLEYVRERVREKVQMEAVVNSSHDGVIAVDRNGRITLVNEYARRMLGLKGDVLGRPITDFIPHSDMLRVLRTGRQELGDIAVLMGKTVVINRFPVLVKNQVVGAVSNFKEIVDIQKMELSLRRKLHQNGMEARYSLSSIVGSSPEITRAREQAALFAKTNATVLILGETGTGKKLFAQGIHLESERALGPFLAINCAALPESLLESELFGYEEGAFTGAKKGGKPGLFELAHGGTLFLDEIGEMPVRIQALLLWVLQEKCIRRIGGERIIPVDVRIIAATNRDLRQEIQKERFRPDLYYRLNLLTLELPPLRRRLSDVPELVKNVVKQLNEERERRIEQIDEEVYRILCAYHWPGNVRELRNVVERMVLLAKGPVLTGEDAMFLLRDKPSLFRRGKRTAPEEEEIERILAALEKAKYNKTLAAKALGMDRTTLWRKMKQYRLG